MISINFTLVFTIFNFILLVFVLKAILFKPMMKYLDERARKIEESLKLAEENKERAEEMKVEYDQFINEARTRSSEIVDSATVAASRESREILAEARTKAKATVDTAREEILMEAEKIKSDLRSEVASMSVALAGKVLEREISEKDHKALIDKSLEVLGS